MYRDKETAYWSSQIATLAGQPKKLWQTFNSLLGKNKKSHDNKNCPSPQQFLDFFNQKIEKIRQNTGRCPVQSSLPLASTVTLESFKVFSADDIRKTIMNAPPKSCALDPVPTNTLKEFLPELLPFLTCMCNASLQEGYLPTSQRHAMVTPRMKKTCC